MKKINSTDLHIEYRMETGEWFQWDERSTGQFHSKEWYSREYALWLEEKLLAKHKHQETVEELLETIQNLEIEVGFWIDKHNNLDQ